MRDRRRHLSVQHKSSTFGLTRILGLKNFFFFSLASFQSSGAHHSWIITGHVWFPVASPIQTSFLGGIEEEKEEKKINQQRFIKIFHFDWKSFGFFQKIKAKLWINEKLIVLFLKKGFSSSALLLKAQVLISLSENDIW